MDTKTIYLWTVICPKKLMLAHNVFEVTELCRTRGDIFNPSLDRTRSFADHYNINKILNVEVIALTCGQKKGQSLSRKIFPKVDFKATTVYKTCSLRRYINFALCCQVEHA